MMGPRWQASCYDAARNRFFYGPLFFNTEDLPQVRGSMRYCIPSLQIIPA